MLYADDGEGCGAEFRDEGGKRKGKLVSVANKLLSLLKRLKGGHFPVVKRAYPPSPFRTEK
jgi:hypothetical protein